MGRMGSAMSYRAFGQSDVGKVRDGNEDFVHLVHGEGCEPGLYLVADGVGGARCGEVASELAAMTVRSEFLRLRDRLAEYAPSRDKELREELTGLVRGLVEAANLAVYEKATEDPSASGMRTTLVVLVTAGEGAFVAHVGDSRAYLLRGDEVYRLTEDHTWANYMVAAKALDPEEARSHPYARVLARTLGAGPQVEVDATFVPVEPKDRFLLCSDGLYQYVGGRDLKPWSDRSASPEELVRKLIREANGKGGEDNVSVVVVESDCGVEPEGTLELQAEITLLKHIFLFETLTEQEILRLMRLMYRVRRPAGAIVVHEGAEGDELFIVVEGEVEVTLRGAHLTTIGAGGHFGELAVIDNEVRAASVTAKTDVTLLTIRRKDFVDLVATEPRLAAKLLWSFLAAVAGNIRSLSKSFVSLSSKMRGDAEATVVDFDPKRLF